VKLSEIILCQSKEIQNLVAARERIVGRDCVACADHLPTRPACVDRGRNRLLRLRRGGSLRGAAGCSLAARRQAKGRVHVDAKHLAEVGHEVLTGIERVALEAPIAVADVEATVGTELNVPADMIRVRLGAKTDDLGAGGVRDVRVLHGDPHL
jgi:hypothetical protein